ncbi:MAG: hypothetical protein ABIR17_04580 [Pseudolysinimonas sp.]|uniref:hypothetical protein n=1 Tax=Pseudolysinimonas sp. TaxID=2680009 RepID=UPI0032638220
MKRGLAIVAGLGLLAATYAVAATTPTSQLVEAPFGSRGSLGDTVSSQHLIATVHEASLAHEVELGSWRGTTAGVWFVADATVEATLESKLIEVDLFIDGVQYGGTKRGDGGTVDEHTVAVRFPATGPLLIELPADVVNFPGARSAVLRISPFGDDRLDSVVEIVIDLTTLEVADRVELEPARDGSR